MLASHSAAAIRPGLQSSSRALRGAALPSCCAPALPTTTSTHAAAAASAWRRAHMLSGGGSAAGSGSGGARWWQQQPRRGLTVSVSAMFGGFKWPFGGGGADSGSSSQPRRRGTELAPKEAPPGLQLATFGGGCFWGLELAYQRVPGVVKTSVGYSGGQQAHPTYDEVCMGYTGHAEVVQVTYDPKEVTFRQLLDLFFDRVDPTTLNRQGGDRGTQYRSAIFTHDEQQAAEAAAKIAEVNEQLSKGVAGKWLGRKVVTVVEPCGDYYLAEKYHQQYLARGGRFGSPQSSAKGCKDPIRCYG